MERDVVEGKAVNDLSPVDTTILASTVETAIVAPRYGVVVAQTQHVGRVLADQSKPVVASGDASLTEVVPYRDR